MRYLLLVILSGASYLALGQESQTTEFKKDWFLDISVGINQSTLSGSAVNVMDDLSNDRGLGGVEKTTRTGREFAFTLRKVLAENFHTRFGFNYLERGGALKKTGYVEEPSVSSNYVAIPALIGLSTSGYKKALPVTFIAEGGVAYLLKVNDESSSWAEYQYSPLDLLVEAGVEVKLNENVALSLRYKFMKNLKPSYSFDWVPERDYDWFYQTNTLLINLNYRLITPVK